MKYKPNLGGHAPNRLREAFWEYLDSTDNNSTVEIDGDVKPVKWLLGQLWNCTDIMPASGCYDLDMSPGSNYAQAVRKLAASAE